MKANSILVSSVLALAGAVRSALDFHARHFGKQVTAKYLSTGGTHTVPDNANPDHVAEFRKSHLPHLNTAAGIAKVSGVAFPAFLAELETFRLADISARKAEEKAEKGATEKPAPAKPEVSTAKAEMKAAIEETKKELAKKAA